MYFCKKYTASNTGGGRGPGQLLTEPTELIGLNIHKPQTSSINKISVPYHRPSGPASKL